MQFQYLILLVIMAIPMVTLFLIDKSLLVSLEGVALLGLSIGYVLIVISLVIQ